MKPVPFLLGLHPMSKIQLHSWRENCPQSSHECISCFAGKIYFILLFSSFYSMQHAIIPSCVWLFASDQFPPYKVSWILFPIQVFFKFPEVYFVTQRVYWIRRGLALGPLSVRKNWRLWKMHTSKLNSLTLTQGWNLGGCCASMHLLNWLGWASGLNSNIKRNELQNWVDMLAK